MFLEIVTPDEKVFEGEVDSAIFPGSDGSFQVLTGHAPMVSTLGMGDIKYVNKNDKKKKDVSLLVEGGVVEVLNNRINVLVERLLDE